MVIKLRLPKKIIPIKNADKSFHEKWTSGRDALNLINPFRGVLLGPPNSGKSTVIKNILLRADPEFEEVIVIHADPEYTKEYEDIGNVKMLSQIPAPDEFEGLVKTLVIIDDIELKTLSKEQRRNLDRLFGFVSTHKNCSVLLTQQDVYNTPPIVRRCSNLWVLWKCPDLASMSSIACRCGISSSDFNYIFDNFIKDSKDSLWIDRTDKTPYPLRINGYKMISKNEISDSENE